MDSIVQALRIALPYLALATLVTLVCSVLGAAGGLFLGVPVGFARLSHNPLVRGVASTYVETVRGTPLLLQLFVWIYGVPTVVLVLFHFNADVFVYNVLTQFNSNSLMPLYSLVGGYRIVFGVIGLVFNYGAYIAEIVRGGIQAVDHGETEAAHSLGLSGLQTARFVVLPQALRIVTPSLANILIALVQDTSFLGVLGVLELELFVFQRTQAISISGLPTRWAFYVVELLVYFAICYPLALASQRLERRTAHTLAGAH